MISLNIQEKIEEDYPEEEYPGVAKKLEKELEDYLGQCDYNSEKKKVIYHDSEHAMQAYMAYQIEEMQKYKWIESQKVNYDLGQAALLDWDKRFAPDFCQFWRKTHEFVPAKK